MTYGKINLHTLDSVAEYYEQGESQHICVGTSKSHADSLGTFFNATSDMPQLSKVRLLHFFFRIDDKYLHSS